MAAAALRFYIYPDAAYDFSAVLECHPSWIFDDQAAEVAMLNLLRRHPSRVNDPEKASLFVVPLLPYVSNAAGECMGESHEKRMSRAVVALRHSPYFKRRYGHDHVLITNTFRVKTFGFWLKPLLGNSTVGKTSLMLRFCEDSFTLNFSPTIGVGARSPSALRLL